MSAQLIELDLETPEPAPVRRRGALLAAAIGAVVIAAVTLTVSHWQWSPKPVRLGSVVRATGLQTCADGQFVGLTFYLVNDDPKPVTLTSVDVAAVAPITDAAGDVFPDSTASACAAGWLPTGHHQVTLRPGDLGVIAVTYQTTCALAAATTSPIRDVSVHLIEGDQTAVRSLTPDPDDLDSVIHAGLVNCDAPANPSVETAA